MAIRKPVAMVAGVGPGLGAALCHRLSTEGYAVAGLARSESFLEWLSGDLDRAGGTARMVPCDLTDPQAVEQATATVSDALGPPRVLIYNAGAIAMSPFADTAVEDFDRLWQVNCRGAFLCARQVVPGMLERGEGTIVFTGASASLKPGARFAAFGAGKFALRGMALSMARELGPQGIHVAHALIDGVIWTPRTRTWEGVTEANTLQPEAIAESYLALINQPRSAWTLELDLRPDVEPF